MINDNVLNCKIICMNFSLKINNNTFKQYAPWSEFVINSWALEGQGVHT